MAKGRQRAVLGSIDRLFRSGTATGLSDGQLLERFATRHDEAAEAAFAALVERHGPMVLGVCQRVLNDPHDAHDAFQATFLVLVRKAEAVRNRESVASWLYGVANRVSAHARSAAARRRVVESNAVSIGTTYPTERGRDAEVWEEVDRLSEQLRLAVVLCYLEGLTHEQAAARLGWPVGTVRSRLARAREKLRTRLTKKGLAPGAALLPILPPGPTRVPYELIHPTVRAAILFAARDAAEAGLVSVSAASLTEGVLRTMFLFKLKTAAVALIAAGSLAAGAAGFGDSQDEPVPVPVPTPETAIVTSDDVQVVNVDATDLADVDIVVFNEESTDEKPSDPSPELSDEIIKLVKSARDLSEKGETEKAAKALQQIQAKTGRWMAHIKTSEARSKGLGRLQVDGKNKLFVARQFSNGKEKAALDSARKQLNELSERLPAELAKMKETLIRSLPEEARAKAEKALAEAEAQLNKQLARAQAEASKDSPVPPVLPVPPVPPVPPVAPVPPVEPSEPQTSDTDRKTSAYTITRGPSNETRLRRVEVKVDAKAKALADTAKADARRDSAKLLQDVKRATDRAEFTKKMLAKGYISQGQAEKEAAEADAKLKKLTESLKGLSKEDRNQPGVKLDEEKGSRKGVITFQPAPSIPPGAATYVRDLRPTITKETAATQRRLDEVERKLDRILKRLDESSDPRPSDRPKSESKNERSSEGKPNSSDSKSEGGEARNESPDKIMIPESKDLFFDFAVGSSF